MRSAKRKRKGATPIVDALIPEFSWDFGFHPLR
jgi:hypothetical protein